MPISKRTILHTNFFPFSFCIHSYSICFFFNFIFDEFYCWFWLLLKGINHLQLPIHFKYDWWYCAWYSELQSLRIQGIHKLNTKKKTKTKSGIAINVFLLIVVVVQQNLSIWQNSTEKQNKKAVATTTANYWKETKYTNKRKSFNRLVMFDWFRITFVFRKATYHFYNQQKNIGTKNKFKTYSIQMQSKLHHPKGIVPHATYSWLTQIYSQSDCI